MTAALLLSRYVIERQEETIEKQNTLSLSLSLSLSLDHNAVKGERENNKKNITSTLTQTNAGLLAICWAQESPGATCCKDAGSEMSKLKQNHGT